MVEPYNYVRFRWWSRVDLEKVAEDLRAPFSIRKINWPRDEREMSLLKDERTELEVKADTLTARLSYFRALLSQKEAAPFTEKDVELRRKVIEIYPRDRPTPFPWEFIPEPKFEVAKKT